MIGIRWADWLDAGDTVIDVGAHMGAYTRLFAEAVGPTGHVRAFEPDPDTARSLRQVCAAWPWVEVCPQAVEASAGTSAFYHGTPATVSSRWRENLRPAQRSAPITVETVCLDDACRDLVPQGIKIDAQGDDGWVLEGAQATLARMPVGGWVCAELWPEGLAVAAHDVARWAALFAGWDLVAAGKAWRQAQEVHSLAAAVASISARPGRHTNVFMVKVTS